MKEISEKLRKTEEAINRTRSASPLEILNEVRSVFSQPEYFVRLKKSVLWIDRMCIKRREDSPGPHSRLDLTEAIIGKDAPRVFMLVKFPRDELLPRMDFHEWTKRALPN